MDAFKNILQTSPNQTITMDPMVEESPINLDLVCTPSPKKKTPTKMQGRAIMGIDYGENLALEPDVNDDARSKKEPTHKPNSPIYAQDGSRTMTINMNNGNDAGKTSVIGGPTYIPSPPRHVNNEENMGGGGRSSGKGRMSSGMGDGGMSSGMEGMGDSGMGGMGSGMGSGMSDGRGMGNRGGMGYMSGSDNGGSVGLPGFSSGHGMGGAAIDGSIGHVEEDIPTYEQIQDRKDEGLARLKRFSGQGYQGAKRLSNTSTLLEIESQVKKLQSQKDLDNSIKTQQKYMIGAVTVIEFLNEKYNPFDLQLEGWSESVYEDISSYDDVFEELYEKYKNVISITPELRLLGMVAGSAAMFHFSKILMSKAKSKVPGFEDVMNADPELKRRYKETAARVFGKDSNPANRKSERNGGGGGMENAMGMVGNLMSKMMGGGAKKVESKKPYDQEMQQRSRPQRTSKPQQMSRPPKPPKMSRPKSQDSSGSDEEHEYNRNTERKTKDYGRVPMEAPHDPDGLLSSLINGNNTMEDVEELDLSEIDNYSDLSSAQ
jgi:hypothetical protein